MLIVVKVAAAAAEAGYDLDGVATVQTVGVPEPAAKAMLFGHVEVALANTLRGSNPFSELMTTLNAAAGAAALKAGVECATDITGFGLLGHLPQLGAGQRCHGGDRRQGGALHRRGT